MRQVALLQKSRMPAVIQQQMKVSSFTSFLFKVDRIRSISFHWPYMRECLLIGGKLPYDPVCQSVSRSIDWSVGLSFIISYF